MFDSFGDGWNGATLDLNIPSLGLSLGTFTLDEGSYLAVTFGVDCETEVVVVEAQTPQPSTTYTLWTMALAPTIVDVKMCTSRLWLRLFHGQLRRSTTLARPRMPGVSGAGDCSDQPIYGCMDRRLANDALDDSCHRQESATTSPSLGFTPNRHLGQRGQLQHLRRTGSW